MRNCPTALRGGWTGLRDDRAGLENRSAHSGCDGMKLINGKRTPCTIARLRGCAFGETLDFPQSCHKLRMALFRNGGRPSSFIFTFLQLFSPRASSRALITSSPRFRASPSRNSRKPTPRSPRR
jgi:hypothetical protein